MGLYSFIYVFMYLYGGTVSQNTRMA